MTERLFVDACVVTLPLKLSAVSIANHLSPRSPQAQGRFLTAVQVRYQPNVSTETAGLVALGLTTTEDADLHTISANYPNYIGPVWKPASLQLPKERINLQDWAPLGAPSLYLVGHNVNGHVTITCTIQLTLAVTWPLPPAPVDPLKSLPELDTQAYVGPVLEGFSLVCCAPTTLQPEWGGVGQVINIDMTRARGHTTTSTYGLATPNNRPYIAVRYGFGSSFEYRYNTANSAYSWKSNTQVVYSYTNKDASTSALAIKYYASWRPIQGSTEWWCDVRPSKQQFVLGGNTFNWYVPMTQLVLYYYFPEVDVFDTAFTPGVRCVPASVLPCPPGDAIANKPQLVPLNMGRNQQLWSWWWQPDFGADTAGKELQYRFTEAKYALTKWPVNCDTTRERNPEQPPITDELEKNVTGCTSEFAWENSDA